MEHLAGQEVFTPDGDKCGYWKLLPGWLHMGNGIPCYVIRGEGVWLVGSSVYFGGGGDPSLSGGLCIHAKVPLIRLGICSAYHHQSGFLFQVV